MRKRIKGTVRKLLEAVPGLQKSGLVLFPERTFKDVIYPDPTFQKLNDILIGDPDTSAAIDFISDVVMGTGFETTMNSEYKETTPNGLTAKEVVDRKCRDFGADQLAQEVVKDVVGYGNCVVWKNVTGGRKIEFLIRVMPRSIKTFNFDREAGLRLKSVSTQLKVFPADQLTWLSYNRIGKQPIGFGILQALGTALRYKGGTRKAFIDIKAQIQQAMADQIEDWSAPNQMWVLKDVPSDKIDKYTAQIKQLKKGQRIVYNKEAQVITAVPERMRGLDFYVETLWNSYFLALQTPLPKLFTSPGFTQASAVAAERMGERKIYALQRYMKRMIEIEWFDAWLGEAGLDPVQAQVRLNWRMIRQPDINVFLPVILKARENRDLSQSEFRHILSDLGLPIKPDEKIEEEPLAGKKFEPPSPTQPMETAEHKYQTRRETRTEVERQEEEEEIRTE